MGPFYCTKKETIDLDENKFNERFGECHRIFYMKILINIKSCMNKVTM